MTQPNPFAAHVPATPVVQPAAPMNPFAAPAPQSAAAAAPAAQQWPAQQPAAPAPGPVAVLDPNRLQAAGVPVVGGTGAKLADMYSRLVMLFPLSIGKQPRSARFISDEQRRNGDLEQDRLVATVVVLDSGPGTPPGGHIDFGGNPHELGGKAHDKREALPYVRKAMWITQSRLISQLQESLPAGPGQAPGIVVGRLAKAGPANNDPWYLIGASPEEMQLAQSYLGLVQGGTFPSPLA
jgi:hypothetical protein